MVHADSGLRSTARVHNEEPTGPIARRYDSCSKCDGISVFVFLCICFKQFFLRFLDVVKVNMADVEVWLCLR